MKKIVTVFALALMMITLFEGCVTTTTTSVSASSSMSSNKVRTHARFLTDRMAYELDFSPMQYDDCFEINYDFLYHVSRIMNDVAHGYYDAINTYYRYLDYRNDDLRYIMNTQQFIRFLSKDYFYRPVYTVGNTWNLRIYTIYSNSSFYYYDAPIIYKYYDGAHSRMNYTSGYYINRYPDVNHYTGNGRITGSSNFNDHRKSDFGSNLRDRNQNPDYNNYNNRNSNNRTADPRYRDNSGNQNTPQINNRTSTPTSHRGASTSETNSKPNSNGNRANSTTTQDSTSSRTSRSEVINNRSGNNEGGGRNTSGGRR